MRLFCEDHGVNVSKDGKCPKCFKDPDKVIMTKEEITERFISEAVVKGGLLTYDDIKYGGNWFCNYAELREIYGGVKGLRKAMFLYMWRNLPKEVRDNVQEKGRGIKPKGE